MTIQPERVKVLKEAAPREGAAYVLYWMQQSQRVRFNPALEFAAERANELDLPLLVCFGLTDGFPEANARHYAFMLQGLAEVERDCAARGIGFCMRRGEPDAVAAHLSGHAAVTVCDRGYLTVQKVWRSRLAETIECPLVQVEGDVVVPVETASGKHEFAARTLRPKLLRLREDFLAPLAERKLKHRAPKGLPRGDIDLADWRKALAMLTVDAAVPPVRRFAGGTSEGLKRLDAYLSGGFARYGKDRGRPEAGAASHMSPYLHFGQISPVELALMVRRSPAGGAEDRSAYLEELIVRRELAQNHAEFQPGYDTYASLPEWARKTLAEHAGDRRPVAYTEAQLDAGETHDPAWNAAMLEMRATGYMHNHMRMYWGKKVLEWSTSPEAAFKTLLRLNNRYFLDGRDANSFTNVAWIFGLHDRPWPGRQIFGSVRSMGAASLKKFDVGAYIATVERLAKAEA